jgi:hypothetical protein
MMFDIYQQPYIESNLRKETNTNNKNNIINQQDNNNNTSLTKNNNNDKNAQQVNEELIKQLSMFNSLISELNNKSIIQPTNNNNDNSNKLPKELEINELKITHEQKEHFDNFIKQTLTNLNNI